MELGQVGAGLVDHDRQIRDVSSQLLVPLVSCICRGQSVGLVQQIRDARERPGSINVKLAWGEDGVASSWRIFL